MKLTIKVPGTAQCALSLDDSGMRHELGGIAIVGSYRQGKGHVTLMEATPEVWKLVRSAANDRAWDRGQFEDPSSWTRSLRVLSRRITAALGEDK